MIRIKIRMGMRMDTTTKIRLGISSCLMGEKVRYDGGHKLDALLMDRLGPHADFVPVCPEVECGLGVPREPVQLEGDPASPRVVAVDSRTDHTERLVDWARKRVGALESEHLDGFILKCRSPSCGMAGLEVYDGDGKVSKEGVGVFARELMRRFPSLPVEEEERLHDPVVLADFMKRIGVS